MCASLESVVRETRLPGLSYQDLTCLPEDKAITEGGVSGVVVKQTYCNTLISWHLLHAPEHKHSYRSDNDAGLFLHFFLIYVTEVSFSNKVNLINNFFVDTLRHESTGAKFYVTLFQPPDLITVHQVPTSPACRSLIFPGIQIIYHSDYTGVASAL